jgi:hypothetical protein
MSPINREFTEQIKLTNPKWSRVETGYDASTVALLVVEGDGKRTLCLGTYLGHHVPGGGGGHKYRGLVLQVGGWTQG